MTDIRLRNGIILFSMSMVLILLLICFFSTCNQQPVPALIGEKKHSKRKTETAVNAVPPQRIDTVKTVEVRWRTKYVDRYIQDTLGYVAVSDTIKGTHGTEFIVEFDTYSRSFDVPYLQERPDTTRTITDSVIVERTVEFEKSTFWSDVGKVAGGAGIGLLIAVGLR